MQRIDRIVSIPDPGTYSERAQPKIMNHIIEWARSLQVSSMGILDVGAGLGIETKDLTGRGIPCVGIDPYTGNRSYNDIKPGDIIYGTTSQIPFEDYNFSGALLKDALLYLSPKQRADMFEQLKKKLTTRGSLLVISETKKTDSARLLVNGKGSFFSLNPRPGIYGQWFKHLEELVDEGATIEMVTYQVSLRNLQSIAERFGFKFQVIEKYRRGNELAKENRWAHEPGFIVRLDL